MNQKGLAPILIVLLIAVLGIGGYFVYRNYSNNQTKPTQTTKTPALTTTDETLNWKTFIDSAYGYSFKYPADYKSYPGLGDKIFYSPDTKFDKTTNAKTRGIEIGSVVYNSGEDTQKYIGPNTKTDSTLSGKLILPSGYVTKAYVNLEDMTITIDYKKDNQSIRLLIWCGGENGNSGQCYKILNSLLSTFKFTQ